jgi:Mannosyl-glycoprotein endo-beta-N-acetylglucosaminidase
VVADRHAVTVDNVVAARAAARVPPDLAALAAGLRHLATAQRLLQQARTALTLALAAVAGPSAAVSGDSGDSGASSAGAFGALAAAGGLSVLGTSALNAAQLTAWYNAQGYFDLTAAPISQLAGWYVEEGAAEGVRGDVAFAQAVLETGGFSSPDAIDLNNYAGIGHCDTCASGWPFPSPHAGVIGHMQLLRIFATTAPAPRGAPAPVLPDLTPAHQGRAGCCPTWESLTGVWATDPIYGLTILSMYQSMLELAATLPVLSPAVATATSPTPASSGQTPASHTPAGQTPASHTPAPASQGSSSAASTTSPSASPAPSSTTSASTRPTSPTTIPAPPATP